MKFTRRDLIKLGAGAGAVSITGGWSSLLAAGPSSIKTTIPFQQEIIDHPDFINEDGTTATDYPANPNGSLSNIAGITDPTGRVLGLMPHPDRSYLPYQHPQHHRREIAEQEMGGATLFHHLVTAARS